jgi:translocation and assembly module TamB
MLRCVGTAVRVLGTVIVFVTAVAAGALIHLDRPTVRRAIVLRVDAVLASTFAGRVVVQSAGSIGPSGVGAVDLDAQDPDGHVVLSVRGLRASVSTWATIASLVRGGTVGIDLADVSASSADVDLDADAQGTPRIARAFALRSAPSSAPGRPVRLALDHIHVDRFRVHGSPAKSGPIDADLAAIEGSLHFSPGSLDVDLRRATLSQGTIPGGLEAHGTLSARLQMPSAKGRALGLRISWQGMVGSLAESASASLDGAEVEASVDVDAASPDAVRSIWPACPFVAASSLHAHADGTLPRLAVAGDAQVGATDMRAEGNVTLGAGWGATAHLDASSIDAHAFVAGAPSSNLSATADVVFTAPPGGPLGGEVRMDVGEGTIGGVDFPASTVHAKGAFGGPPGATRATATVNLRKAGAPASITVSLEPRGTSFALTFQASAVVPRLEGAPRLGGVAAGEAAAAVSGSLDLATRRLEANAQGHLEDLRLGAVSIGHASFVLRAAGPATAPWIDATVDGSDAAIGPLRFSELHATTRGTAEGAPLDVSLRGRRTMVHGHATAALVPRPSVRDVAVDLERDGKHVRARADLVTAGGGDVRVDDLEVDGLGAPMHATLRQSPGVLYVRAHSKHLDLAPIGALFGAHDARGRVALDIDALLRANGAQGRVQIDVHDAALGQVTGVEAHVGASLDGRHVAGSATVAVADVASLDLQSTSLEIGGSDPPSWSYWKRAWGTADVAAHVDLARLAAHLDAASLPLQSRTGTVDLTAHFERSSMADATPGVDVFAHTTGLVVGGDDANAGWRLEGVDATAHVKVDGQTGHTAIDFQLADSVGPLLFLTAASDGVPYGAFFAGEDPLEAVRAMPFEAEVTLPSRDVGTYPRALGTRGDRGLLQADLRWSGSALRPAVDVTATLRNGRADVRLLALPLEGDLTGHYDGSRLDAALHASARGRHVLDAGVALDVRAADVIDRALGTPLPWSASARAKLSDFPLQSVGALDDRGLRGEVSGDFVLDGLHADARAALTMTVGGLRAGDLSYKGAKVTAQIDGTQAAASLQIDQDDGFATAHATLGTHWGAALAPALDASKPIDVSLTAKQYRIGLLAPFLGDLVSQIDGRLGADASLRIDPRAQTIAPQGTLSLQDGTFELDSLGGAFHDVSAQVQMTPDGIIRVHDVSASGMSGRLEAAATARVDGYGLSGLRARIQVPQKEQLPVVFGDVQVGTFYGALSVDARRAPDGRSLAMNIGVQSLHVALPLEAGHDVQTLGPIDDLQLGDRSEGAVEAGAQSRPAPPATPLVVTIDLGKDVEVTRNGTLDVALEGQPTFSLAGGVRAGGQIRLARGKIDVQGKEFTLDSGTVTFVGDDPSNPQVALTAKWQAPDGTVVYADFLGPLKTGKVTLRSEPSRSQNEILALILFGSTDDAASAASNDSGTQGLSVVGGAAGAAATQPINRMLDTFGLAGGVSTKIDTSTATPRPEVEVQIARDITLQVAWVLGVPPPGSNPDSTLVTLSWRFLRQWSLATTVGDAGTSILDLIWRHRY